MQFNIKVLNERNIIINDLPILSMLNFTNFDPMTMASKASNGIYLFESIDLYC